MAKKQERTLEELHKIESKEEFLKIFGKPRTDEEQKEIVARIKQKYESNKIYGMVRVKE
jgi:hypothetical protein